MRRLEFSLVFFFILTLMMLYSSIPGAKQMVFFSALLIILFYLITGIGITRRTFFITALKQSEEGQKVHIWMRTFAMVAFALSILTFVSHEMYWRYREVIVFADVTLLTVLMFLALLFFENRDPKTFKFIMWRSIIASLALIYYTVTPISLRLKWQHDDQYYREILLYSIENPDDDDARQGVIDYERRLNGQPYFFEEDQGVEDTQE